MEKYNLKYASEKIIWFLLTFLLVSFFLFYRYTWGKWIFFGITTVILIIDIFQNEGIVRLVWHPFQKALCILVLFSLFTCIWAWSSNDALEKTITITQIAICMSIIYIHYCKDNNISALLSCLRWAGYCVAIYSFWQIGLSKILYYFSKNIQLQDAVANINSLGMFCAICIVISLYELIYNGFSIDLLLMVPTVIFIALCGSRTALIGMMFGSILLIIIRYAKKNVFMSIIRLIIITFLLYFSIRFLMTLQIFSTLNNRMVGLIAYFSGNGKVDSSTWLRHQYIQMGWYSFLQRPLLGVGMGNSHLVLSNAGTRDTYIHNNYIEMLVDGGIIGFVCFYGIYAYLFYNLWKKRKQNNINNFICFIIMIMLLLMDYGSISYYSKEIYYCFMLVFLHVRNSNTYDNFKTKG